MYESFISSERHYPQDRPNLYTKDSSKSSASLSDASRILPSANIAKLNINNPSVIGRTFNPTALHFSTNSSMRTDVRSVKVYEHRSWSLQRISLPEVFFQSLSSDSVLYGKLFRILLKCR